MKNIFKKTFNEIWLDYLIEKYRYEKDYKLRRNWQPSRNSQAEHCKEFYEWIKKNALKSTQASPKKARSHN